jgi:glycosyltransferase involved in cell wall biosynthesis
VHVLELFQPETGGVPAYVARVVPGLLREGIEVTVAGPASAQAASELRALGVRFVPLELSRSPRFLQDAAAVRRLVAVCREGRVSLIHGHSTKAGMLAALVARQTGVPSLYTPHGWAFERVEPGAMRVAYALFERHLVRRHHAAVLTVSRSGRSAAERWRVAMPGSVHVVPTGLEPLRLPERAAARSQLGLAAHEVVAVWVGRPGAQKRPEDLVPIARRLAGRLRIVAVCHEALGTPLADELRAAGVMMPGLEIAPASAYAASDLMLATSAWEAAPLAVLEAMSAGLPIVAYDVGGVGEQVRPGRTGYLVAPGDIEMLCDCALSLAARPDLRARMGRTARERGRREFTYGDMIDQIVATYRALGARTVGEAGTRPPTAGDMELDLEEMVA